MPAEKELIISFFKKGGDEKEKQIIRLQLGGNLLIFWFMFFTNAGFGDSVNPLFFWNGFVWFTQLRYMNKEGRYWNY